MLWADTDDDCDIDALTKNIRQALTPFSLPVSSLPVSTSFEPSSPERKGDSGADAKENLSPLKKAKMMPPTDGAHYAVTEPVKRNLKLQGPDSMVLDNNLIFSAILGRSYSDGKPIPKGKFAFSKYLKGRAFSKFDNDGCAKSLGTLIE